MELTTVQECFKKYIEYLDRNENITQNTVIDYSSVTIQDIDKITQNMFMEYVIKKCGDKVNHTSVTCTLYKHLNTLIRQYIQDESNKETSQMKDYIMRLEDENVKYKKELSIPIIKKVEEKKEKKGWWY